MMLFVPRPRTFDGGSVIESVIVAKPPARAWPASIARTIKQQGRTTIREVPSWRTAVHQDRPGVRFYFASSPRTPAWMTLGDGNFASRNARAIAIGLP